MAAAAAAAAGVCGDGVTPTGRSFDWLGGRSSSEESSPAAASSTDSVPAATAARISRFFSFRASSAAASWEDYHHTVQSDIPCNSIAVTIKITSSSCRFLVTSRFLIVAFATDAASAAFSAGVFCLVEAWLL